MNHTLLVNFEPVREALGELVVSAGGVVPAAQILSITRQTLMSIMQGHCQPSEQMSRRLGFDKVITVEYVHI